MSFRSQNFDRTLIVAYSFMALWAAICLTLWAGLIYAAFHFIKKLW